MDCKKSIDSHSKVPIELQYLETGLIPLEYKLASRRINNLHTMLTRDKEELTYNIYCTQTKLSSQRGLALPCD